MLTTFLEACTGRTSNTPVRVLLLSRTAGAWWSAVRSASRFTGELLGSATVAPLAELETDTYGRDAAYREAVTAFAAAMPRMRNDKDEPWEALAAALPNPDLENASTTALTVHMTALVALLDAAAHVRHQVQADDVEDRLLEHEERYWRAAAAEQGLLAQGLSWETMRGVRAAAGVAYRAGAAGLHVS